MTTPPPRSAVSELLYRHLTDGTDLLVGRGEKPPGGGWTGTEPDVGTFTGYLVLGVGRAGPYQAAPQVAARGVVFWQLGYTLTAFGGAADHADYVADLGRAALPAMPAGPLVLDDVPLGWQLERVEFTALGEVTRSTAVNPPQWSVGDACYLLLALQRPGT